MIMSHKRYKNFDNRNFNGSIEEWCKMVNDCRRYHKNFNFWKWLEFQFYIKIGRIKASDVCSHHPYWSIQVRKNLEKSLKMHEENYKICIENQDKIKYLYNLSTSLNTIEEKLEWYKKEIKKHKVKIFFFFEL